MKFRKKPVVIEATQWFPGIKVDGVFEENNMTNYGRVGPSAWIATLEGRHEVSAGDWIITGVKGEKYPCKPDIFEITYEKLEDTDGD
jgi:hypothetical protein